MKPPVFQGLDRQVVEEVRRHPPGDIRLGAVPLKRFVRDGVEAFLGTPSLPQLSWTSEASAGRVETRSFSYPSTIPLEPEARDLVQGSWVVPRVMRRREAVIVLNGAGTEDLSGSRMLSRSFVEGGCDAFHVVAPFHMQRASRPGQALEAMTGPDIYAFVHMVLQGVSDVERLVLALRTEGFSRVYLVGLSFGGLVVALSAHRTPVDGLGLIMPLSDAVLTLWEILLGERRQQAAVKAGVTEELARRALSMLNPLANLPLLVARERIRVHLAIHDGICPASATRIMASQLGAPHPIEHDCDHFRVMEQVPQIRGDLFEGLVGAP